MCYVHLNVEIGRVGKEWCMYANTDLHSSGIQMANSNNNDFVGGNCLLLSLVAVIYAVLLLFATNKRYSKTLSRIPLAAFSHTLRSLSERIPENYAHLKIV